MEYINQVALRWLTQRGIVAIPKSSHKERMAQNLNIFDFTLTPQDMEQIATLNQSDTGFVNFSDMQFVKRLIETYGKGKLNLREKTFHTADQVLAT